MTNKLKEQAESIEGELIQAKGKPGPKPKYRPEMCETIITIAGQGGHIAAMRNALGGICKDTWYEWKEKYPDFATAVKTAESVSLEFYENIGLKGILGEIKGFNAPTYMHLMANKFKEEYSRGSSSDKTEINLTTNTIQLQPEQITQRIAQRLEQLQGLGVDILNDNAKSK